MPGIERRVIAVEGTVQGVGFRPFVHRLATELALRGFVRNDAAGVHIDVEGEPPALDRFVTRLTSAPPPLATVSRVEARPAEPRSYAAFTIEPSGAGAGRRALVSPDVATCDACLAELADPTDRRYRYPFINCAHCGPRFTIVRDVPYDRPRTTMARFAMCAACRREYGDPRDRRFHAQPVACPACGPTLELRGARAGGRRLVGEAALGGAVRRLLRGHIVAVKGLGGYHLACDATNAAAVRRLRERKRRAAKPLAVMVPDLDAARALCIVGEAAATLTSPRRPIVLLEKRAPAAAGGADVAEEVAPRARRLGVMLPYTPLHHLLLRGTGRPLVMTSANPGDEPIVADDDEARLCLAGIADALLAHDRPIAVRCDDSVVQVVRGAPAFVRRARGFAPEPIEMARPFAAPVLAVGGHLKNTFCLGKGRRAWVSAHVGDLAHPATVRALREGIAHYRRLFDVEPEVVARDLHPDYLSSALADEIADATGAAVVAVQHHHAHVAACLAEHRAIGPAIGVAFDGAGLGADGAIWGGEFLVVDGARYERAGHLAYVPLPGGDAAARDGWRAAAAHLYVAYGDALREAAAAVRHPVDGRRFDIVRQMMARGVNSPPTSSAGRLFDAVASLLGIRHHAQFEAQAAMELEAAADRAVRDSLPAELVERGDGWVAETSPIVRAVVAAVIAGRPAAQIAGMFHNAMRDVIVAGVERVGDATGLRRVALSGGVFQNVLLTERTAEALDARGYEVLLHRRVPCGDGGLSLGQAYVAGTGDSALGTRGSERDSELATPEVASPQLPRGHPVPGPGSSEVPCA